MSDLAALEQRAKTELAACTDEAALRPWHTKYFGDKGEVSAAMKAVGDLPHDQRKAYGQEANRIKAALTQDYEQRLAAAKERALNESLTANPLDVTLAGRPIQRGRLHVATQIMRQIYGHLRRHGLPGLPHPRSRRRSDRTSSCSTCRRTIPARDMWDTFHTTTPGVILRTHTSPGQIHVMREFCPEPIRVILPGMCYRYEAITTRSEIQFQQVEGLVIGTHVTMADLKGTIIAFARRLFGQERQVRFRSSYFPFTEPSIEVDIDWPKEDPNADRLTKGTGWLEIMGAGMVHPVVLRNGGYDPATIQRLRLRHGPAAHHDAETRHRRHPPILGQRRAVFGAILILVNGGW